MNKKCIYGFFTCSFIGQVDFCNSCDGGQNYQMKESKRGGKRKGAGRPKSLPTKVITFRVQPAWEKAIRKVVADEVKRLKGIG